MGLIPVNNRFTILGFWVGLFVRHCEKYLVAQEIVTIHSEADVRTRWEMIHSIKGQFTKSNLETVHKEKHFFLYFYFI